MRCGACRTRPPAFAYARTAAHYDGVAQEALKAFKFGGRRALAAPLGDLVAEIGLTNLPLSPPDLLVPVPLHPARERERGFNQALLLARRVGQAWDVPVETVLARGTATRPQTDLTAEERRANVRGAFVVRRPERVAGKHVLVLDDIVTTGSTVSACASARRDAGAAGVGAVAVARAD
jgi:ComF family protein